MNGLYIKVVLRIGFVADSLPLKITVRTKESATKPILKTNLFKAREYKVGPYGFLFS